MKITLEECLDEGYYVFAKIDGHDCMSDGQSFEEALKNVLEAWDLHKNA